MKSRRKRLKIKIAAIFICLAITAAAVCLRYNVTNILIEISSATVRSYNAVAVNNAVLYVLGDGVSYSDLVLVEYDASGDVSAITADGVKINKLARDAASLAQTNLNKLCSEGINVPVGAFTGVEALAGFGNKVNIKIIPIASVSCNFVSGFEQAGINQTRHSLYLEVVSEVSIVMPAKTTELTFCSEALICESIIVGKIPDAYLQAGLTGGLLTP